MDELKIALLQMTSFGLDETRNLAKAESFCRAAAAAGTDIAVLPEMWNIGYSGYERNEPGALERWHGLAIRTEFSFVSRLQMLAGELGMAIVATYLQSWDPWPRNVATLIDRSGRVLGTYAKVHTCDFNHVEAALTPGNDFLVFDLQTAKGVVRTGLMICYDFEFPESGRILMLKGAELILTPVACELDDKRHGQLQARARENAVVVGSVNYPAPFRNGRSVAFDAAGDRIAGACGDEAIVYASVDLERLRSYREMTIWGNAYRRPQRYGLLADMAVAPPFRRRTGLNQDFDRAAR